VCCSVLQYTFYDSPIIIDRLLLKCGCSVLQCVAICCSVLQCVAVCCNVLQCVAVYLLLLSHHYWQITIAVCCSVLQCVAVCCSVLQCTIYDSPIIIDRSPDSSICVTWLFHVWHMTHSYVRHNFFICVTWPMRMCHLILSHGTWLIRMCDMTHSYEACDSFMYDVTYSYV